MRHKLFILISFILFSGVAFAQPGWQDFTTRYFYTILDKNGKEISFKNNKNYSIMIDNVLYKSSNIPNDSLKNAEHNYDWDKGYENQIKINDFSMVNYQNDYSQSKKRLEIKIIHKKDTMYICQPSGTGSTSTEWLEINNIKSGHQIIPKTDFTLQFIAGHYYFPGWSKGILDNIPKTSGNIKIVNINQRNFIIPKNIYDSIPFRMYRNEQYTDADNYVVNNFMKGHFSVEKKIEPTKFDKSALPYKYPSLGRFFPTKKQNLFFGMIGYSMDYKNCFSGMKTFSVLNKIENTIEQFFLKENPRLFGSADFYMDTFNSILYLPVVIKQEFDYELSDCQYDLSRENRIYQSENEGQSWTENKSLSKLFNKYNFRSIRFLDKDYTVAFSNQDVKHRKEKYNIKQTTYYLLKNMQIVDSVKTPDNAYHYNTFVNEYYNQAIKDSIILGNWSNIKQKNDKKPNPYFQAVVIKKDDKWILKSGEDIYTSPIGNIPKENANSIKEYQNFRLINKQELVSKNGLGSLKLNRDIREEVESSGTLIFEKGDQIYLINTGYYGSVYMSFNKGTTWYLYPLPLEQGGIYRFLDIDEQDEISHFSNEWIEEEGRVVRKIIHKFSLD